jgi:nucleoside-diphosphate-sugar epimerase
MFQRQQRRSASDGITVLVTGASGMLGVHIVEQLLVGEIARELHVTEVRAFDIKKFVRLGDLAFETNGEKLNTGVALKCIQGDMTNVNDIKKAVSGCNAVIHACSVVDFGNVPKDIIWNVNVKATTSILNEAIRAGVKSFIYTSSLDVVLPDTLPGLLNADESAPYAEKSQHSVYVKSKTTAEKICLQKAREETQMNLCAIRPPGIYGERSLYHITAELVAAYEAGSMNHFKIGLGESVFQRCYVGNVAHVHMCGLKTLINKPHKANGKIYFAVDNTPVTNFFRFSEPYLKAKGHVVPFIGLPYLFMYPIAAVVETTNYVLQLCNLGTKTLLFTREAVQGTCLSFSATGLAARTDLNYEPLYSKQEAFDRTLRYYLQNPNFPNGTTKYNASEYSSPTEELVPPIEGREKRFKLWFYFLLFLFVYLKLLIPYEINIHTDWETVSTNVPLENVFDVLFDFESYKEWNSFTYDVQIITKDKGTVSAGDSAELKVNLRVPFTNIKNNMILDFKFLEILKNSRICWAYQMVPMQLQPYILKTRRCMEVKESNNKDILVRHYDINSGPLAPIIGLLFYQPIVEGFHVMTMDLKEHLISYHS